MPALRLALRRPIAAVLVGSMAVVAAWAALTLVSGSPQASGATGPARGYWLGASDGGIFNYGDARFFGSTGAIRLNQPIVGMAATPSGNGYWLVASDGGIFNFGDARFFGSTGAIRLNRPIVGMAATPSGNGYWLVASDGGIFNFGDAKFSGSSGNIRLNQPIVGMAATPSGNGYWLAASDGGIFNFGDASFFGSTGAIRLNRPVVGMAATPTGRGYWLVASDGGIFNFGDAKFSGSTGAIRLNQPIVGMAATPSGNGYWLVASDGGIFNFGDATFFGSAGNIRLNRPIVGMAPATAALPADTTGPTVTVSQALLQSDPTNMAPINFSVVFSEPVAGFTASDVTIGGTAGGPKSAVVTGTGAVYNVAVSGMTSSGTVTVAIPGAVVVDVASNPNLASTSTDNTVTFDNVAPAVTVNQAAAQADPTNTAPVNFTVTFSEPVIGFTSADVTIGGTAGGTTTATVTGTGPVYNVAVTGMTTPGTITASVAAGAAADVAGNTSTASTSTDNTVGYDATAPTVTDVTSTTSDGAYGAGGSVTVTVAFSEPVTVTGTPTLALSSGGTASYASGTGTDTLTFTYTVAPGENTSDLDYSSTTALALSGGSILDAAGNDAVLTLPTPGAAGSLGANKNIVIDTTAPTFDSIEATMASTTVTATFSEPILCSSATAEDFLATVGGDPVSVSTVGCTGSADDTLDLTLSSAPLGGAEVIVSLVDTDGSVSDVAGNMAPVAQRSTTATTDVTVTLEQAVDQTDPTNSAPINFTVVFSEDVTGFDDADVTVGGTAGGTLTATVTGSGSTYNVAVNGMTISGTVTASIVAGAAVDGDGNASAASTSSDNAVTWDVAAPTATVSIASGQDDPANTSPINFAIVFSEVVTGFTAADLTLGGTAGGTLAADVTGSGSTYNVAVSGMTTPGTVTVTVGADAVVDEANNGNTASNTASVAWDAVAPTLDRIELTLGTPNAALVFSEPVLCSSVASTDFPSAIDGSPVGVISATCTGTTDATIDLVLSSMVAEGDVLAVSATAEAVTDAAGNGVVGVTRTAATMTLTSGSTADGATVGLGDATYSVTATDDGTIASLVVLLDGNPPVVISPVCSGTGTETATCTYDATELEPLVGAHTFTFIATDDEGNVTTTTRTLTVAVP